MCAVGLVVEGSQISVVVPGGPCDKVFSGGGSIQEGDEIVEVDGVSYGAKIDKERLPAVRLNFISLNIHTSRDMLAPLYW